MGRSFEVREVAELLGTTPRRVEGWVERGLIRPTRPARGPGTRRTFATESLLTGLLLLRVQAVMGERNEDLNHLVQRLVSPLLQELVDRLNEGAAAKRITLVVINYTGAKSKVAARGNPEYQVALAYGDDPLSSG